MGVHLASLFAVRFIELTVFAPLSGKALRWALKQQFRSQISTIAPSFESSLYIRQFSHTPRVRRISCDPLLHYVIVGWREGRTPASSFDPWCFNRRNPELSKSADPFALHIGARGYAAPCHDNVDRGASNRWDPGKDSILTVNHGRGGGSSTFLDLFEANELAAGFNVFRLRAVPRAATLGIVDDIAAHARPLPASVFDLATELVELAEYCRARRVTRLVINHVIDRPPEALSWVKRLSRLIGCGYEVILHDYYALCPRVNMLTGLSEFCDVAPPEKCVPCTASHGSEVKNFDAYTWRRDFLMFIEGASKVTVPSADLGARFQSQLPSTRITVWQPEIDASIPPERTPSLAADEPLRVLSIGALSVPKGANVLAALASLSATEGDLIAFTLVGSGAEARRLRRAGVQATGFYRSEDLGRLIDAADAHVVFFPSIWPETWSFVLTSALQHGLPVIAFDIGAPADRLRELGRGHLLPLELAFNPSELLEVFRRLREQYVIRQG